MSEESKVVVEELPSKIDDVDDKSVVSSSDAQDQMSTSTYNTAQDVEEGEGDAAARKDVTLPAADDSAPEEVTAAEDEPAEELENGSRDPSENHHDEDDDGHLSDDQRSNVSSVGGSSGRSQVPDTERQEGDGEEEEDKKDKKLDHDEDRRDPQYIPKRGVFYEHDDRTMDDDPEVKKEPVREPRKNKAFEAVERWGHDMFNEDEQSPKTAEELIDIYGYDIRKEEAPPKARRRRRYGKGPNKYQRSWEDEQAYNKTPVRGGFKGQKRSPRNFVQRDEDFPALEPRNDEDGVPAVPQSGDTTPPTVRKELPRPAVKFNPKPPPKEEHLPSKEEVKDLFDWLDYEAKIRSEEFFNIRYAWHFPNGPVVDKGLTDSGRPSRSEVGRGRTSMPRRGRIVHDQIPPFTGKGHPGGHHHGDRPSDKHGKGPSTADEDIATLAQHFSNAVINIDKNIAPIRSTSEPPSEERPSREVRREREREEGGKHHGHAHKHGGSDKHHQNERHQGGQTAADKHHPPPEQPSTKSKRYSTQRQRPNQQISSTQAPAGAPPAAPPPAPPTYLPPQQGYYPPPQHGMCPPEGAPHMSAPPPSQFPPPPGGMQMVTFLPSVPPPPTNTFHPPPNVYVPPAPYIPPPPIVQPPPAEVYQGGVTYYNTHSQVVPRAVPSRRVKLAIPIVSPDNSQPIQ